jgi:hypothetical protein
MNSRIKCSWRQDVPPTTGIASTTHSVRFVQYIARAITILNYTLLHRVEKLEMIRKESIVG